MRARTRLVVRSLAVVALASLTACERPADGPATNDTAEQAAQPEHVYTVRGQIVSLPSPDRPLDDLSIKHEAIPDFKHRDNVVHGMKAMTMPFPVDESVSLDGFEVGDLVRFTFVTVWGEHYPEYRITEIVELPADTELELTPGG